MDATESAGPLWDRKFHDHQSRCAKFLDHYHKRSNVEVSFKMIKAKFRDHVRSRSDTAMRNDVLCEVFGHNTVCVIEPQIEHGIEPIFWPSDPNRRGELQTPYNFI